MSSQRSSSSVSSSGQGNQRHHEYGSNRRSSDASRSSSSLFRDDNQRDGESRKRRSSDSHSSDDFSRSHRRLEYSHARRRSSISSHGNPDGYNRNHGLYARRPSGYPGIQRAVWIGKIYKKGTNTAVFENSLISELRSAGLLRRGDKESPILRCIFREDLHDAFVEFRSSQDAKNCLRLDKKEFSHGPLRGVWIHVSPWTDVNYFIKWNSSETLPPSSGKRPKLEAEHQRWPSPHAAAGRNCEGTTASKWAHMPKRAPTPPKHRTRDVNYNSPALTADQHPPMETAQSSPSSSDQQEQGVDMSNPLASNSRVAKAHLEIIEIDSSENDGEDGDSPDPGKSFAHPRHDETPTGSARESNSDDVDDGDCGEPGDLLAHPQHQKTPTADGDDGDCRDPGELLAHQQHQETPIGATTESNVGASESAHASSDQPNGELDELKDVERMKREMLDITRERDRLKDELGNVRYKNLLLNGRVGKLQEVEHECDQLKDDLETMRANREIELGASSRDLDNPNQRLNDAISQIKTLQQELSQAQMDARISQDKLCKTELENEFLSVELGNVRAQCGQTNDQLVCIQRELASEQAQHREIVRQFELNQKELEVLRHRIREMEANQLVVGDSEQRVVNVGEHQGAQHPADQMDYMMRLEDTNRRFASVAESLAVATGELAVERKARRDIEKLLEAERTRRAAAEQELTSWRAQAENSRRRTDVKSEIVDDPSPPSV